MPAANISADLRQAAVNSGDFHIRSFNTDASRDATAGEGTIRVGDIAFVVATGLYTKWNGASFDPFSFGGGTPGVLVVADVSVRNALASPTVGQLVLSTASGILWKLETAAPVRWIPVANYSVDFLDNLPTQGNGPAHRVYVETPANGGDDVLGEGTVAAPFATLQAAIDSAPGAGRAVVIVRCGIGTFTVDNLSTKGREVRFAGSVVDVASIALASTTNNGRLPGKEAQGQYDVGVYAWSVPVDGETWVEQDLTTFGFDFDVGAFGHPLLASSATPNMDYIGVGVGSFGFFADLKVRTLGTVFTGVAGFMRFWAGGPEAPFSFLRIKIDLQNTGFGTIAFTGAFKFSVVEMYALGGNNEVIEALGGFTILEITGMVVNGFRIGGPVDVGSIQNGRGTRVHRYFPKSTALFNWVAGATMDLQDCVLRGDSNGRKQLVISGGIFAFLSQCDFENPGQVNGFFINAQGKGTRVSIHIDIGLSTFVGADDGFFVADGADLECSGGSVSGSCAADGLTLTGQARAQGIATAFAGFTAGGSDVLCGNRAVATFAASGAGITDYALGDGAQGSVVVS